MTITLIDGDLIAYRCASSCEPTKNKPERESLESGIHRATDLLHRILSTCATEEYRIFLSSSENFRKTLDPSYKANRADIPKPQYLDPIRNLLVGEWGAEICTGYEADDGIGIAANESTVICTIDKDLRQIPGRHYHFVKDETTTVGDWDAVRNFYLQMLTGDSSDNVFGIRGVGPVNAGRILDGVHPKDMEAVVYDCYRSAGKSERDFYLNHCLLRIIRSAGELSNIETIISQTEGAVIATESLQRHSRSFSKFNLQ